MLLVLDYIDSHLYLPHIFSQVIPSFEIFLSDFFSQFLLVANFVFNKKKWSLPSLFNINQLILES